MKKVLIIGEKSYIGKNLKAWLLQHNYSVVITSSRFGIWKNSNFSDFDVVVDCAGKAHVNALTDDMADDFYAINRDLTVEIAQFAKAHGVRHFVYMSAMNVYGDFGDNITNQDAVKPNGFYGYSKLQGDLGCAQIEDTNYIVSRIRAPFVYGKNCSGNYSSLSSLAQKVPFFPNYPNKKSMLYIDNLCEFIRLVIEDGKGGIFTPQNKELVSTATLVKTIAKVHGKNIFMPSVFNPLIKIGNKLTCKVYRAFGNDNYALELSNVFNFKYCIVDFDESIRRTEL